MIQKLGRQLTKESEKEEGEGEEEGEKEVGWEEEGCV